MKQHDALMKALEEKGIIRSLKIAASVVPLPDDTDTEEKKKKLINTAVKLTLFKRFAEDEELGNLFAEYSYELGINALLDELNIQPSEKEFDIKALIKLFFGGK